MLVIIEVKVIIGINSLVISRHPEWANLTWWTPKETKGTHLFIDTIKIQISVHSMMIFLKNRLLIITKLVNYLSLEWSKEILWFLSKINKNPVFKCNICKIKIKNKKRWLCQWIFKVNLQSLSLKIWFHRCSTIFKM